MRLLICCEVQAKNELVARRKSWFLLKLESLLITLDPGRDTSLPRERKSFHAKANLPCDLHITKARIKTKMIGMQEGLLCQSERIKWKLGNAMQRQESQHNEIRNKKDRLRIKEMDWSSAMQR